MHLLTNPVFSSVQAPSELTPKSLTDLGPGNFRSLVSHPPCLLQSPSDPGPGNVHPLVSHQPCFLFFYTQNPPRPAALPGAPVPSAVTLISLEILTELTGRPFSCISCEASTHFAGQIFLTGTARQQNHANGARHPHQIKFLVSDRLLLIIHFLSTPHAIHAFLQYQINT